MWGQSWGKALGKAVTQDGKASLSDRPGLNLIRGAEMSLAYLEKLNSEQRRAVEHGVGKTSCAPAVPLQ